MRIYRDSDADLGLLQGKQIAVIGYGNQGRAQALNLRGLQNRRKQKAGAGDANTLLRADQVEPVLRAFVAHAVEDEALRGFARAFTRDSTVTTHYVFSGDARQAMGIQRIQGDLCRLYQEARREIVS